MERETTSCTYRTTTLKIENGSVVSVRRADVTETGLRLFDGSHIGVAGALGIVDEGALEARAREALTLGIPYTAEPSGPLAAELRRTAALTEPAAALAEVEAVLAGLRSFERFSFSGHLKLIDRDERLSNSRGLALRASGQCLVFGLLYKEANSGSILDGGLMYGGRRWDREAFVAQARDTLEAFGRSVDLPAGDRHLVVLNESFAAHDHVLLFFANALNGRAFGRGASLLSGKRGERVFAETFGVEQTRHPDDTLGGFYDDEGTVTEDHRFALIEGGVVKTPFTDKRTAAEFGLPHTGAAACVYDGVPRLSCPMLRIPPSTKTLRELLGGRPAVWVDIATGGDFTPDGHYAAPVQLAFLFDGERFVGRLPQLRISSNVFDMFGRDFKGVSADVQPAFSTNHRLVVDMQVAPL